VHPVVAALNLEALMREALAEAEAAGEAGDYPIGAVLVVAGEIVARGRARHPATRRSQLAHAELDALLGGGEALWERYEEAVLFSTVEPCPMCLGAAVMADVPHVVFAAHDALPEGRIMVKAVPYVRRHIETYLGGVLEAESRAVIGRYHPALLEALGSKPAG
jgi:tRNA(adenine34) deaminase